MPNPNAQSKRNDSDAFRFPRAAPTAVARPSRRPCASCACRDARARRQRRGGRLDVGSIDKYGLDLGFTGSSYIVWTVLAPSLDIPSGALAGNYGGVSAEATVGLGVGTNALLGGSENSIALQPVSVQAQQGLNVAVGVSALSLRFDGHY